MASTKGKTVGLRLDKGDYELFYEQVERLGTTPSAYLRTMVRAELDAADGGSRVREAYSDAAAIDAMRRELVRWGYHYNQAVHALNSVAFYVRHAGPQARGDYIAEQYERANGHLEEVREGAACVAAALDRVAGKREAGGR